MSRDAEPHIVAACLSAIALVMAVALPVESRELLAPKEQAETGYDAEQAPSLDEQARGRPQSIFVWIQMAKGYEVEWDSFGRQGWYTQDPRIKPVAPGTHVFPRDTPAVYIVFEVAPQEDPARFGAQWYLIEQDGKIGDTPIGRDALDTPGHERFGFLELKQPGGGWQPGEYLVKIYITPQGQQAFHAANQVGTMRFRISDQTGAAASAAN